MTWFKKKLKSLVTICLAAFLIVSVLPQTSVGQLKREEPVKWHWDQIYLRQRF